MTDAVTYQGLSSERRRYTTLTAWRSYVHTPEPPRPLIVPASTQALWTPSGREAHLLARRRYHRQFDPLITPAMREAHRQILLQAWEDLDGTLGAKTGGAIDGHATLGKTTILCELGKRFQQRLLREHPLEDPRLANLAIPVVYITLPAKATPKVLNVHIAQFFDLLLPTRRGRITTDELSDAIAAAVQRHGTLMILVDDLHFLQLRDPNKHRQEGDRVSNEHLKYLANILDVTFVYAGIDLEKSGLFDEGALLDTMTAQTGGRFMHCKVERFQAKSGDWLALLDGLEEKLVLERLEKGTLRAHAGYLYARSQGSIGILVNLVRKAANLAVGTVETVNEKVFSQVKLARNAEFQWERSLKVKAGKGKAA